MLPNSEICKHNNHIEQVNNHIEQVNNTNTNPANKYNHSNTLLKYQN